MVPLQQEEGSCPDLTGLYEYQGKAADGFPTYYRALKTPLTLDRLLGTFAFGNKYPELIGGQLSGIGRGLELTILGTNAFTYLDSVVRPEDRVVCEAEMLRLEQHREVGGDGAYNKLHIIRTASIEKGGALQVNVTIRGSGRFLFFFWYELPSEEYQAVFLRKAES
ncbi:hypothetical protein [Nitrospira japonica]|nr:hypothetical protein [Nitrospira japonica]